MPNYRSIKAWARKAKCSVADLIALAPQNDPFYMGTPGDVRNAEWFADLWNRFGYDSGVHVRRVHYQIISQKPPVRVPNGDLYENTERCWRMLNAASKSARYLGLVDPAAFVDRRNPQPTVFTRPEPRPHLNITPENGVGAFALPEFPELPGYDVTDYAGRQRYLIEVWCEKSTMNDVLLPLCQDYGVNLVTGVGELSITAVLNLVLHRIKEAKKPTRILYVSDFDPAGMSMPVAVSRKIEYFVRNKKLETDIRLYPTVLNEHQVDYYDLPRTPIKESEARKAHFEDHHGRGATELDALEALHPGALREILESEIRRYYDRELEDRAQEAFHELQRNLDAIESGVRQRHAEDLAELEKEYQALREAFAERVAAWQARMADIHDAMRDQLEAAKPDLDAFPVPVGREADEPGWALYDSRLDYEAQLAHYKAFQNGVEEPQNGNGN